MTSMMSDVRRLAEKYENPRQLHGQARIVLHFGHLHWGARGLTNHELKYGDLLNKFNQYVRWKKNKPPHRSDEDKENNGVNYGQQNDQGEGQWCNRGQGQQFNGGQMAT
jgi:endonuclease IV